MILIDAREEAARVAALGDDSMNDLIISKIIRTGEMQAWFLAEHLVDISMVRLSATMPVSGSRTAPPDSWSARPATAGAGG